jgi:allantoinase
MPSHMLPQHLRYNYSPITERQDYSWPGGKRLAFCITTNIECFAFTKGRGHDSAKHGEPQTQRNYAWRDYGNRVGIWRLFDLFEDLKLPAAHNTNSLLYDYAPQILDAIRRRGDEIVGHGRTNAENLHDFMWEADEARVIKEVTDTFIKHEGRAPKGWMGAGAYENSTTPDLLKEAGFTYLMDWPCDDQPIWFRTRSGPILSVPYPVEINDTPAVIHRQHSAREFCDMLVDQFDEMIEQCVKYPLVLNISLHPYVFGQPFRLRPLRAALRHCVEHERNDRIWFCRPGDVADYCYSLPPGIIPGGE